MQFIAHHRKSDNICQSVQEHLEGVAKIAQNFLDEIGLGLHGELIGLIHDWGKYADEFQKYIKSAIGFINEDEDDFVDVNAKKGKIDHSSAGAQWLWSELSKSNDPKIKLAAQILAICDASHHSGLIDCIGGSKDNFGQDEFLKRMEKEHSKTHLPEVLIKIDLSIKTRVQKIISDPKLVGDLLKLIQRISDGSKMNDGSKTGTRFYMQMTMLIRFIFSCLIDADRLDTADFSNPKSASLRQNSNYINWSKLSKQLDAYMKQFDSTQRINKIRNDVSKQCFEAANNEKRIFVLSVPTGGGKTLASLRFALRHANKHKMTRIIYFLPFTSIIDQNAQIVRDIMDQKPKGFLKKLLARLLKYWKKEKTIVLEHHSNLTPEENTWATKILSENWDAPIVYTTNVQILEALFGQGTRGTRRMHQLSNSILVFDEIQTLPIKCIHLFNNAINFLINYCGCSVVFCTATQPLLNKVSSERGVILFDKQHEIIRNVQGLFSELKRVELVDRRKSGGHKIREIAQMAVDELNSKGNCLVVVNTKKNAKLLEEQCRVLTSKRVIHLSTHMCPVHRKKYLSEIKERLDPKNPQPILCISTQLIEAGVDVDFNCVIRFLAGLDSIAQAAGRCNRNCRLDKGFVYIVTPEEENIETLRGIREGKEAAERVFDEYKAKPERFDYDILGPKAIERYFQLYFYEQRDKMIYPVDKYDGDIGRNDTILNLLSKNEQASSENRRIRGRSFDMILKQSFMTAGKTFKAISTATQGILVPFEEGKKLIKGLQESSDLKKEGALLRKMQQYAVNIFPQVFEELLKKGKISEVQKDAGIYFLNDESYYDNEFGLNVYDN